MKNNITRIAFYICVTIIICVMFISCTIDDENSRRYNLEKTKIPKSDFEVCVESCPSKWTGKNQECVDKCIEKILK